MITINGKEYGLFYSVGAHIRFDEWVIKNEKSTFVEGLIMKFRFMVQAYNEANGTDMEPPTKEEIFRLPNRVIEEIAAAIAAQEKIDTEVTVEAESGKKAKSAGK